MKTEGGFLKKFKVCFLKTKKGQLTSITPNNYEIKDRKRRGRMIVLCERDWRFLKENQSLFSVKTKIIPVIINNTKRL